MRESLQNHDWHLYGLSIQDIEYTISIEETLREESDEYIKNRWEMERVKNPDIADDIMDDIAYYSFVNKQYILEFCIIRILGIFEALIQNSFINEKAPPGLSGKIKKIEKNNYTIENDRKNELRLWISLRNSIIHHPSEIYKPLNLIKEDIEELKNITISTLLNLEDQRVKKKLAGNGLRKLPGH